MSNSDAFDVSEASETVAWSPLEDSVPTDQSSPENLRRWLRLEMQPGETVPAVVEIDGTEIPVHICNQSFSGLGLSVLHHFADQLAIEQQVTVKCGSQEIEGIIRHITNKARCAEVGVECTGQASS